MSLEGTLTTPVGPIPKKAAVLVGGGLALILAVIWYRNKQLKSASVAAAGSSEIDPATGFPYGSAEDAAALAAQANFISPGGGGGGGGGGTPGVGTGFTNNAQWSQAVVTYMTNQGLVADPSQLAAALGKYLNGSPVDSVGRSLIEQAIAVEGMPPLSGSNGYPPAINTSAVVTPSPPDTTPPTTIPPAATATNPFVHSNGTMLSVGTNADLYAAARSVGLDGGTFAALNPQLWKPVKDGGNTLWGPPGLTPYAARGMSYRIK